MTAPSDHLVEGQALLLEGPVDLVERWQRLPGRATVEARFAVGRDDGFALATVGVAGQVRVSRTEITAVCLDTGELACRHARSFARHRTITAIDHASVLRERRGGSSAEPSVETRPLTAYDALIA